jgi:hypothetical protein
MSARSARTALPVSVPAFERRTSKQVLIDNWGAEQLAEVKR